MAGKLDGIVHEQLAHPNPYNICVTFHRDHQDRLHTVERVVCEDAQVKSRTGRYYLIPFGQHIDRAGTVHDDL